VFFVKATTIGNTEQSKIVTIDEETWYPKLSKSEQTAYNKDVSRLRVVVKPKTRSNQHVSVGEIHALIRNTHSIRRRMLAQNPNADFITNVLQYQEIFHEEAVRILSYIQCCIFNHNIIFLSSFFYRVFYYSLIIPLRSFAFKYDCLVIMSLLL
jgi:hypothetical protein